MQAKKYLYAAIGAQVAAAKSAQAKVDEFVGALNKRTTDASTDLAQRIDVWAGEGEAFIDKMTDTKAIDDIASKVDFDQVQTQVNKLRDQLEDLVSTWRTNFRPEGAPAEKVDVTEVEAPAAGTKAQTAAKKPAAKSTTAKSGAKNTATKKAPASKPAAKKPAAKSTAAKSTAKKTEAKAS